MNDQENIPSFIFMYWELERKFSRFVWMEIKTFSIVLHSIWDFSGFYEIEKIFRKGFAQSLKQDLDSV